MRDYEKIKRALTSPVAKRFYGALIVLLVAFLWANMVRRALAGHGSQFDDFINFSRDLVYGHVNVYAEYPSTYTITKYPPFFSLLFAPLVPLPTVLGASFWFLLSLGLSLGATYLGVLTVDEGRGERQRSSAVFVIPYLLTAGIIGSNLETAQVNIVIVFVLCLALYSFRRGADTTSGMLLGLITALKLTPGLFIAYFLYKRAYKVVAGAGLGLLISWVLIPPLVFGPANFTAIMISWWEVLSGFISEGTIAEGITGFRHTNQSLSAALHRFFTDTPAGAGRQDFYINFASLSYAAAAAIVKVLALSIILFLAWISRTPTDDRGRIGLALEYSLVMIATLFISPISWINHYVILLFPYITAVYYLRTRPSSSREYRVILYSLIVSFLLVSASASRLMQAFSLPLLGAIVLAAGLAVALRAESSAMARGATTAPAEAPAAP